MAGNPVYPFSIVSGLILDGYGLTSYRPKVVGFSDTAEILHKGVASQVAEDKKMNVCVK